MEGENREEAALSWHTQPGGGGVGGVSSRWGPVWLESNRTTGTRTGTGARQPYLARSLLVGGGAGEGQAEKSPGCSGTSPSVGGRGGCTLGGVEEHLREEDEPRRDTHVVSITLTPMLQRDRDAQPIKSRESVCLCVRGSGGVIGVMGAARTGQTSLKEAWIARVTLQRTHGHVWAERAGSHILPSA